MGNPEHPLADAFVAHLPRDRPDEPTDDPSAALEVALAELVERARAAWPALVVPPDEFAAYLAERVPAGPITAAGVAAVHAGDLYLACAGARGDGAAVASFERRHGGDIDAILTRFDAPASLREEARQLLMQRLFVATAGRPPRIADYAGRGELLAFVRIAALRIAIDLLRKRQPAADDDELLDLPAAGDDPELQYLKALYRREFRDALTGALAALDDHTRAVLHHHLVDRLSIDQIGVLYDVHRATAARWLNRARESVARDTRRALVDALRIERGELDSILRLVRSSLDVSVGRLLREQSE